MTFRISNTLSVRNSIRLLALLSVATLGFKDAHAGNRRPNPPLPSTYPSYVGAGNTPSTDKSVVSVTRLQSLYHSIKLEGTCANKPKVAFYQVDLQPVFPQAQTQVYFDCHDGFFSETVKLADNLRPGVYDFRVAYAGTNKVSFAAEVDTERYYLFPDVMSPLPLSELGVTAGTSAFQNGWYVDSRFVDIEYRGAKLKPHWLLEFASDAACTKPVGTMVTTRQARIDNDTAPTSRGVTYLYAKITNPRANAVDCRIALSYEYVPRRPSASRVHEFSSLKDVRRFSDRLMVFNPEPYLAPYGGSLKQAGRASLEAALPSNPQPQDVELFEKYATSQGSQWKNNWLAKLDFTGVGWDAPQDGALITTRHVVFADHYARTGRIVFHQKDGTPIFRNIVSVDHVRAYPNGDVALGKLDVPVPDGVKVYPILDLSRLKDRALVRETPLLVAEQHRRMLVRKYSKGESAFPTALSLDLEPSLPSFFSAPFVPGDSSNPAFFMLGGELFLAMTLTSAGNGGGESLGDPAIYQAMQNSIQNDSAAWQH
jgi:hypothetical protein